MRENTNVQYAGTKDFHVWVVTDLGAYPLPHHIEHSPCGHSWGYWGSGPADLARDLFAHVVGVDPSEVEPFAWRLLLDEVVALLPREQEWWMDRSALQAWIDSKEPDDCGHPDHADQACPCFDRYR